MELPDFFSKNTPEAKPKSIALVPLLSILCIVYFIYHLINGDRGMRSYFKLNQKIEGAEKDLAYLEARKKKLEERTSMMSADHLDPELLDERIRAMLGYVGLDEKVIYLDAPRTQSKDYNVVIVPEMSAQ